MLINSYCNVIYYYYGERDVRAIELVVVCYFSITPALDNKGFGQEVPSNMAPHQRPPTLPPQLLQIVLNKETPHSVSCHDQEVWLARLSMF